MKEVRKVFRVSAVQNTILPFPQWKKQLQDMQGKKNWKNKKLQVDIWEEMITSTLYTLRKGTGQIYQQSIPSPL